ncbi:hypothetical protein DTO164E3_1902 [Paecilomyces variotii]|nr:hypothetical protein DTO164E3_1902 [Paecilomyces variotii]KAJ9208570.1 hypothetical protein DTO032I3_547 [Paecilomyces variotii]KAJ9282413.1 hypothetical protein DTO021D3_561 [Paecilomyces variotii]KAJ9344139.1 hypothetical protein DTO027B6_3176 [Paecilomyces variotii]KAJ9389757.1 hypothetical protein DTO032I4_2114 [Paecilomyces variotii]
MSHSILLTGASGYLGGTIAARWQSVNLPAYKTAYALVRTSEQAQAVKQYGFEPLTFDLTDEASVTESILDHEISIVYFLIDSVKADAQVRIIKALAQVKEKTGQDVHFLHTSGAKLFSGSLGIRRIGRHWIRRKGWRQSKHDYHRHRRKLRCAKLYLRSMHRLRQRRRIRQQNLDQTVAIVQAAKALRRVYRTQSDKPGFGHGKKSFFLATSGSVAGDDIYDAFAKSLAKRNVVDDETVHDADEALLKKMGQALACPKELVPVQLSGKCTFTAGHGEQQLGWKPQYRAEHILEAADAEVETILKYLKA